jgi:hypothetical protein
MARLFLFFLKITVFFMLLIAVSFALFGSSIFKYSIQKVVSITTGKKIKIEAVQWSFMNPLEMTLKSANYIHAPLNILVRECNLKLNIETIASELKFVPGVDVTINGLTANYKLPAVDNQKNKAETQDEQSGNARISDLNSILAPIKIIKDFKFRLKLKSSTATFEMPDKTKYQANDMQADINLDSILNPIVWDVRTNLKLPVGDFDVVPFMTSGKVELKNGFVEIDNALISVLEIPTSVIFKYGLNDNSINLKTTTSINDLETIPLKNKSIPISKWSGKVMLSSSLIKKNGQAEVEGNLQYQFSNALFNIGYITEDLKIAGDTKLNAQGKIPFTGKKLGISELSWNFDLTELEVLLPRLIHKQRGVELKSTGLLKYNKALVIERADLHFYNIAMSLVGLINEDKSTEFKFNILPTDLVGMERIILPLGQMPLQGKIQLSGAVNGNLSQPLAMNLKIDSIKAKDVSGYISYLTEKISLRGPLALNLDGALIITNSMLQAAQFNANVRATDLDIKYGDLYVKPKGSALTLAIDAQKDNEKFRITDARFSTSAGVVAMAGGLPLPPNFEADLQIEIPNWDLASMKTWLPKLGKEIPAGSLNAKLKFNGRINTAEPLKSDIVTSGDLAIKLPMVEVAVAERPEEKLDKNGKLKLPARLLPDLDLVKNLDLNLELSLGLLKWKTLVIEKIQASGNLAKSIFKGQLNVQKIFSGQVIVNKVQVPLQVEDPLVQFDINTQMIDVDGAIATFLPQWKGMVNGKANMKLVGGSKLPASPKFMESLRVDGDFLFKDGILTTLPIVQIVQKKLEQYPAIKDKVSNLRSADGKMKLSSRFLFENQRVQLNGFEIEDASKNLIQLNGKMDLNLNLDLKGKIAFFTSPVGGSFYEANKDTNGRLVVPVHFSGNAKSPDLHTFDDTLKLMIANTVDYEKKRAYRKISGVFDKQSEKMRQEAENQLKQQKKKIEDEMRKRLEGLVK